MRRFPKPEAGACRSEMILQAPLLAKFPWLVHGFTTRRGGVSRFADSSAPSRHDLNLGQVPWDSPRNVRENRRRLLAQLHAEDMKLLTLRQIHSDLIRLVDSSIPAVGDGLVTDRPGLLLSIVAADCLPVLLVDVKQRVIGAFHCGWRGTARRIAEKGVGLMRMVFDSRPQNLRAAIGPGIRACCYKVGPEVQEEFEGQFFYASKLFVRRNEPPDPLQAKYARLFKTYKSLEETPSGPQLYLDLVLTNVMQLCEAGLSRKHIYSDAPCTSCHPELFFSHRRDAGRTGRMMGVVGIRRG